MLVSPLSAMVRFGAIPRLRDTSTALRIIQSESTGSFLVEAKRTIENFPPDALEEAVELCRVGRVEAVDGGHGVPLHAVLLEQADAAHNAVERPLAQRVVQAARAVDAYAYEEALVAEEAAPLVGEQRAVGLQAVVYVAPPCVAALQLQSAAVERHGAQQRLAPVPGEEHLPPGLRLDVLAGEGVEQRVVHHAWRAGV